MDRCTDWKTYGQWEISIPISIAVSMTGWYLSQSCKGKEVLKFQLRKIIIYLAF